MRSAAYYHASMNAIERRRLYSSIAASIFITGAVVYVVRDIGHIFPARINGAAVVTLVEPIQQGPTAVPNGRPVHSARAVDGDTLNIKFADSDERVYVRLIGVNTPESVDPRKSVQCFGKEASRYTATLMSTITSDTPAYVVMDSSQNEHDRYGRLLAYVYLPDGSLLNERIIADGYGFEYTYRTPYIFQTRFKAAERAARAAGSGLWATRACSGEL